jgi:hypothetical protein
MRRSRNRKPHNRRRGNRKLQFNPKLQFNLPPHNKSLPPHSKLFSKWCARHKLRRRLRRNQFQNRYKKFHRHQQPASNH